MTGRLLTYGRKGCTALVVLMLIVLSVTQLSGQNIENILEQKVLTVNGGVNANTTFYDAQGIENRRDPFYWLVNANLNFNILGIIQAPFSMTVSQQDKKFSQPEPFNRFGISPQYKSITGHFGHRSMTFSDYTLAGTMFLGAGVEVNPKESKVRVSAMYGRLAKAVNKTNQEGLVFAKPTFKRMGYGFKVGVGKNKHITDFILFRAVDDPNSIEVTDDVDVMPEENLVGAIVTKHALSQRINVEVEYAYSLFTRDKRALVTGDEKYSFMNNLGGIYTPNMSSEANRAFTITSNYTGDRYQVNIKYRDIDPGYRTLGSAFLNNGMKDITGGVSWNMLQQKLSIGTNAGFQQTTKENSVVRVIYSVNAAYNSGQRLNVNSTFSNFSTTTRQTQIRTELFTDTLEYFQVTRSGSFNVNYAIGRTPNSGNTVMLAVNAQDATDSDYNDSHFYSLSVGNQLKVLKEWSIGISATYNRNMSQQIENASAGPVLNINRSFREGKIRSAASVAYLTAYVQNDLQSKVMNASLTNSLRVGKKHSFGINAYYLRSEDVSVDGKTFSEIRGIVNYNYNF